MPQLYRPLKSTTDIYVVIRRFTIASCICAAHARCCVGSYCAYLWSQIATSRVSLACLDSIRMSRENQHGNIICRLYSRKCNAWQRNSLPTIKCTVFLIIIQPVELIFEKNTSVNVLWKPEDHQSAQSVPISCGETLVVQQTVASGKSQAIGWNKCMVTDNRGGA